MDFVQFLDLLKQQKDIPNWEQSKKDITEEINAIILSTQNITDRFKRKKVQKMLTPLVQSVETIFDEIDQARENGKPKLGRIQRCIDVINDVKSKMEKLAK